MATLANGNWKGWLVGIVGTLVAAAVTNGIVFQRETNETLAHMDERIKVVEARIPFARDNLIREFGRMDARMDKIIEVLTSMDAKITTAPEIGQQLRERDLAIQRMEKKIEELEKRK